MRLEGPPDPETGETFSFHPLAGSDERNGETTETAGGTPNHYRAAVPQVAAPVTAWRCTHGAPVPNGHSVMERRGPADPESKPHTLR